MLDLLQSPYKKKRMTNSRQIKFRTFFREEGVPPQMIYFHLDDFIRNESGFVVGQVCLQSSYQRGYQVEYWPIEHMPDALPDQLAKLSDTIWGADSSPLMQFTGLKDKAGREVYEGDIIKYKIPWLDLVVSRRISYSDEYLTFVAKDEKGSFILLHEVLDMEDVEVVGNVYENQELLK